MGCDIHLWVEKKTDAGWEMVMEFDTFREKKWFADLPEDERVKYGAMPYEGRNYSLFAILANVRNRKEDPLTPIDRPRGIPDDASVNYLRLVAREISDGHSHSWFTLLELLDFEGWDQLEFGAAWESAMERIKAVGKPDEVRIVFFFDN